MMVRFLNVILIVKYHFKEKVMIQIILKDKLNPYREKSCVFETRDPVKACVFINALKSTLLYDHWEIKTEFKR